MGRVAAARVGGDWWAAEGVRGRGEAKLIRLCVVCNRVKRFDGPFCSPTCAATDALEGRMNADSARDAWALAEDRAAHEASCIHCIDTPDSNPLERARNCERRREETR
jgi:hypothetical protein